MFKENRDAWFTKEDIDTIVDVIRGGQLCGYWRSFLGGQYLKALEKSFTDFVGRRYAIAVSSGTTAIHAALCAAGVKEGDRVVVSPYTPIGSVSPILMCGAIPVFVDVEPRHLTIDPVEIRKAIKKQEAQAIIAVHHLGFPCEMDEIREIALETGAVVIEDASQALGAEYHGKQVGSLGDLSCFSIGGDMTKSISTGEGGIILTNGEEIAHKCRTLRNHGDKYERSRYLCYNYRLSEIQAAIGYVQMRKLRRDIDWQTRNAKYLIEHLPKFLLPPFSEDSISEAFYIVGCTFTDDIHNQNRAQFFARCREIGIDTQRPRRTIGGGYDDLVYSLPMFEQYRSKCPVAETATKTSIWIDYHRYPVTENEIDALIGKLEMLTE